MSVRALPALTVSIAIAMSAAAHAQQGAPATAAPVSPQQAGTVTTRKYEDLYERYLASARSTHMQNALWMADLTTDPKARRLNDLVTVKVIESLTATGTADANVAKTSDADVRIPANQIAREIGRILPFSSETTFNGAGGTTRSTQLSATVTARVVEVLPNGDLVIEGVREVDINGDRNLVVLTGVIRSVDVQPGNVVLSARVGQLQIRSLSQGLIKDSLTPGWLIRALNKVF